MVSANYLQIIMKRLHTNLIYVVFLLMVPIFGALVFAINTTTREELSFTGLIIGNILIGAFFAIILKFSVRFKRVFVLKKQIVIRPLFSQMPLVTIPLDKVLEIKTTSILSPLTCRLVYLDELNVARTIYFIHSLNYILVDNLGVKLGIVKTISDD